METTLAAVYAMDMGRRTEDLDLWGEIVRAVGPEAVVVEVGVGLWRIARRLRAAGVPFGRWVGIDVAPAMLRDPPERCIPIEGDASNPGAWTAAARVAGVPDLVIVPYHTLFLLPHDRQATAIGLAAVSLASGGVLAVEVYNQRKGADRWTSEARLLARAGPGGKDWARITAYERNRAGRTTLAVRSYGPFGAPAQVTVREAIYWRPPAEVAGMVADAGMRVDVKLTDFDTVIVTGRKS